MVWRKWYETVFCKEFETDNNSGCFLTAFSSDLKAVDLEVLQTEQADTVFVELPTEEEISTFNQK